VTDPLEVSRLSSLMAIASGRHDIAIGLVDGPVDRTHPALASAAIDELGHAPHSGCAYAQSLACIHGTFIAGILVAKRSAAAPGICEGCRLVVRPVFDERAEVRASLPTCSPENACAAIVQMIDAGVRVINLSIGFSSPTLEAHRCFDQAIDHAMRRGVIVVMAAGNQGQLAGASMTRHAWVIHVVACDAHAMPSAASSLGASIARHGLMAPGHDIRSTSPGGGSATLSGTSVAAPFVTGTIALLWSMFPRLGASEVRHAVLAAAVGRRRALVPSLLDAWGAYESLQRFAR
jgi:subtilisin family serine protease